MSLSEALVIAVDGPSASGKSTVSRSIARRLNLVYVDSGSLYRGLTWKALREGVGAGDREGMRDLLEHMALSFHVVNKDVRLEIDGEDPGSALRSEDVASAVSDIAAMPEVRRFVVEQLRNMTRFGSLVMEGRDIGTVVFPSTPYKFYLDADPRERALRRLHDHAGREGGDSVDDVLGALQQRDRKDTTRDTAPLQIAPGAYIVNSTNMSIDEVVDLIASRIPET